MNPVDEMVKPFDTRWDTNHEGYRAIFNAAISGITANPNFFGSMFQQQPEAAVDFANEVVLAAIHGNNYVPYHQRARAALKEQL